MNTLQRNLWILVTVSALAILLQNAFYNMNVTTDISQYNSKCEEKKEMKHTCYSYSSSWEEVVEVEKKSCKQYSYTWSSHSNKYPDADAFVAVDKLPSAINFPAISARIEYPAYAREKGIEGLVLARILVDEKGNYVKHKIVKSDNCGMRYHVEKHIRELEFIPAEKDGQQVAVWVNIPFRFRLEG